MRRLGDFREFSTEIGTAPSIIESFDENMPARLRRLVAFYLLQGGALRYTMERLPDVVDGEDVYLSGGLQTDGEWFWRTDLAHYVMKYGLALPGEFIDHASANSWNPPELTDEDRGGLAAELRRRGV